MQVLHESRVIHVVRGLKRARVEQLADVRRRGRPHKEGVPFVRARRQVDRRVNVVTLPPQHALRRIVARLSRLIHRERALRAVDRIAVLPRVILEIARVDVWLKRRNDLLAQDLVPVNAVEPLVCHHLLDALAPGFWVALQHPRKQVLDLLANVRLRQFGLRSDDFLKHLLMVLVVKRWQAGDHFVQKDA